MVGDGVAGDDPSPAAAGHTAAPRLAIHVARFADLTPHQLYEILRLRVQVFTVEQDCVYQDLDGRDTESSALLLWQEAEGRVAATLRLLEGASAGEDAASEEMIIGRVVTAPDHRGRGLAADLMRRAIELAAGRPIRISAQAHLQRWYEGFGFAAFGEGYLEDGIPHVAMRRPS